MRDVAVIQRFLPSRSRGGVGHFTHGLCQALVRRGNRVTVFSQDPAPAGASYTVQLVPLPSSGVRALVAFPFAVARCDFRAFDVIHAQGDNQWIGAAGRPPLVRTMHGSALAEAWFNGVRGRSPKRAVMHLFFYAMELVADLRADTVVLVSADTARFYPRTHGVIPNGVDLAALAPDGTPKSPAPSVLFIGEIDSRKRGRLLLDVFAREVRPAVPDAELWLVSPDRAEGPGVVWCGTVDDATLAGRLRRAWVMCLPSAYEGFGRPYIEAMAAGTAVVASWNPGARAALDEGRVGVMADDAALGSAIVRLLTDVAARASWEKTGLAHAQRFGWDRVAAEYEAVYDAAIARRGRHA